MTMLLRLSLVSCLLILLVAPVHAQNTRSLSETVALAPDGEVSVETYAGSITVSTWNRDEVSYDVRIEPGSDPDLVDQVEIDADHSSHRLRLRSDYDRISKRDRRRDNRMPHVHYTIRMPRGAELDIDDYKSNIDVSGLEASLRIDTYKGPISVKDQRGPLTVDTYKSEATLENVTEGLSLETYKGTVDITNLRGELEIDTYKGDVKATLASLDGDVEVDTYKGNIALTLPSGAGFDLRTDLGSRADLRADVSLSSIRNGKNDYRGAVNGGGPYLRFQSYKGSFELRTQ